MAITGFYNNQRMLEITITGLLDAVSSETFQLQSADNATIQVTGTFGGTTATPEGSNDGGVTWAPAGTALTAAGTTSVNTGFELYRITTAGGGGTTDLSCFIAARFVK